MIDLKIDTTTAVCVIEALQTDEVEEKMAGGEHDDGAARLLAWQTRIPTRKSKGSVRVESRAKTSKDVVEVIVVANGPQHRYRVKVHCAELGGQAFHKQSTSGNIAEALDLDGLRAQSKDIHAQVGHVGRVAEPGTYFVGPHRQHLRPVLGGRNELAIWSTHLHLVMARMGSVLGNKDLPRLVFVRCGP